MAVEKEDFVESPFLRGDDVHREELVEAVDDFLAKFLELGKRGSLPRHLCLQRGLQLVQFQSLHERAICNEC